MKLRTQLVSAFSAIIVIICMLAGAAYHSTQTALEHAKMVAHTYEVLAGAHAIEKLVIDMDTGSRGFVLTGQEKFLEPFTKGKARYAETLAVLKQLVSDNPPQVSRLAAMDFQVQQWHKLGGGAEIVARRALPAGEDNAKVEAMVAKGTGKRFIDRLRVLAEEFKAIEEGLLEVRTKEADAARVFSISVVVIGAATGIFLAVIAMIAITRGVLRRVGGEPGEIELIAETISTGDLTVDCNRGSKTPTGILASLGKLQESLRQQTRTAVESANRVAGAASEIVATCSQLASGATETAAAVSETTITVEEVRQTAQVACEQAQAVSNRAQRAAENAVSGRRSTDNVVAGMSQIRQQMDAIATRMVRLSEKSEAIGQIIALVEDLAAQSNLLAVNAAIEAARAGEHGKGFAVVAQEIKSLAEQSRQATSQVQALLGDIQKATTTAVIATEQGSKAVAHGEQQTAAAGESIEAMASSTDEAAQAALQITASEQQQLVGLDQVGAAMKSIQQASSQNMLGLKQMEAASRDLNELAAHLEETVAGYKV